MGLFDEIEALTTPKDPAPGPAPAGDPGTGGTIRPTWPTTNGPHHPAGSAPGRAAAPPGPAGRQQRRPARPKPERLAFLQPCPLCGGRQFIHGTGGGFYCVACQPGQQGLPVEAAGPDRQERTEPPEDLTPAGDLGDGQHHQAGPDQGDPSEEQRAHFRAAWPWIKEHLAPLLAAGWTRAALLRRAKFRWPYGPWGVAWLSLWSQPELAVTIGPRGEIVFTFPSHGRTITQTAHPPQPGPQRGQKGRSAAECKGKEAPQAPGK